MAISERDRHEMHAALRSVLGEQEADTLMEHLPPVGWADVATKRDLDALGRELRLEFRAEMERGFARTVRWNVGTVTAMAGIVLAITRFV